jgi:hypothetical protein
MMIKSTQHKDLQFSKGMIFEDSDFLCEGFRNKEWMSFWKTEEGQKLALEPKTLRANTDYRNDKL